MNKACANQLHHPKFVVDNKRIELLKYLYSTTRNLVGRPRFELGLRTYQIRSLNHLADLPK